ncbi:SCO family protein [Thermomonas carbonis]|uniref:SCO family protein n=1 Tax=Thermomonas carbonis TaxID=1463158 RepID=A0A7G9SQ35_9GAMM|nr:SCO family protein [Thermomonas carbonis]QNN69960.1 SCO family protein [Thermomonas carbonis]GHB96645.1 SCO family protein [Thermomonas carbonis]
MSKRTALLLLVACLAGGLGLWASQRFHGPAAPTLPAVKAVTLLPNPRVLPAFSLQQSDGTALDIDDLKGRWTVVFLGFTHCPDICPTTLAQLAAAQKQWATLPAASRPRVLFISTDPERDTPKLTGDYAHAFHPDTLAATGPIPQLEAFTRSLSLVFMKAPGPSGDPDDYSIDHSAAFVLLDPQARMAGVAQPPFDIKAIATDLESLTKAMP